MPGPPGSGGGRGWGHRANAVPKPKAAPIARPSTNYEQKLLQREYNPEEKARRDEQRRLETERRLASRAAGKDVDLGRSAEYWNQVTASKAKALPYNLAMRVPSGGGRGRGNRGGGGRGGRGGADVWRQWRPRASAQTSETAPETWTEDTSWLTTAHASAATSSQDPGAAGGSGNHEDPWEATELWQKGSQWDQQGHLSQNGRHSVAGGWGNWEAGSDTVSTAGMRSGGAVPSTLERSFTAEEKARRAALRQQEAENRRRAKEVEGGAAVEDHLAELWRFAQERGCIAPVGEEAATGAKRPSAPPKVLSLQLAGQGLDDERLEALCAESRARLERGEAIWPDSGLVVDLRDNHISDKGLGALLALLCKLGAQPEELLLTGNPLKEPLALHDLLIDERAGLGGRLWHLELAAGQLTCECFWRILEICCRINPRPPLCLGFLDGELGELRRCITVAERYGLWADLKGLERDKAASSIERLAINADVELVYVAPSEENKEDAGPRAAASVAATGTAAVLPPPQDSDGECKANRAASAASAAEGSDDRGPAAVLPPKPHEAEGLGGDEAFAFQ
mmetsp:Transcript_75261/g.207637  ORF Transcript_75261/g.207637 Transcript_75261/m.207637 type:complete len:569 (+) Transcript_75261:87-1793(+)